MVYLLCRVQIPARQSFLEGGESMMEIIVSVRWNDGYLEKFICSDVRFGCDLLWLQLHEKEEGTNRHIPLRQVRWFSVNPESHEAMEGAG